MSHQKKYKYESTPAYSPGMSTLLLWPLLSLGTTVGHIFVRAGLLGAVLMSRESGIVAATGLMSVVMCIWLDALGKKSPMAGDKATDYKFWGFALVVIGIGVSLAVHYAQTAIDKRSEKMRTAVSSNVSNYQTELSAYNEAVTTRKDCIADFKAMSKRKAGQSTVLEVCGAPPTLPVKTDAIQDQTTGVMDFFFAEALALILLSCIGVADLLIYGHGLKTVYKIAKGSYTQQRVRLPPNLYSDNPLPTFPGDRD